jgi:hypothetical protein
MSLRWACGLIFVGLGVSAQDEPKRTLPYSRNLGRALDYLKAHAAKCDTGIMCYLGWAFLLEGSDELKPALDAIVKRALKACVEEKHFNANWYVAHSMLFLSQVQKRRPDDSIVEALKASIAVAARTVEPTGGWCHHKNYGKESDYLKRGGAVDLSMLTALMLAALACAKAAGVSVPEALIENGLANLKRLAKDGNIPYGTQNPVADKVCTRGAMAAYALWMLGKTDDPLFDHAKKTLPPLMGQVEAGHACGAQNFFAVALGSYAIGRYDAFARASLGRLSQKRDGSVVMRNDGSKDLNFGGGHLADTAVYALMILLQTPKILEETK